MGFVLVSQLWRYPVKSLRGEALETACLTLDGVSGDRVIHVAGHDIRRLRPNIVLSGIAADLEPDLPGQTLAIGEVLIGVHSVRQRCVVTTIDPATGVQDLNVLRRIREVCGGEVALNCWVIRPGTVHVGDTVRFEPAPREPDRIGGWIVGAPYPHATR